MELLRYVIIWWAVVGTCFPRSVSPKALANINKKINLLRKTFQRELSSHQREIDDLKFEVLDLKTDLHIEKAKTAGLEELLNRTNYDVDLAVNEPTVTKQEHIDSQTSFKRAESRIIQQHSKEIQEVKETIESHRVAIYDNTKSVQISQSVCETLYTAFQDEKKSKHIALDDIMKERQEDRQVDQALSDGLLEIRQTVEIMTGQVDNNTDNIALLQNEDQFFKETLEKALVKMKYQHRLSSELSRNVTSILQKQNIADAALAEATRSITLIGKHLDSIVKNLSVLEEQSISKPFTTILPQTSTSKPFTTILPQTSTSKPFTTILPQTSTSTTLTPLHQQCLDDIRAGGEAMAKRMYRGVIVKRGKNWTFWSNEDGGKGHGEVIRIGSNQLAWVTWDSDSAQRQFVYRIGVGGKYELAIVEEKYDFSYCK